MVAHQIALHAPQRVDRRRNLMHDVETNSFRLDHFLQTADLPFNVLQARQLAVVTGFDTVV